MSLTREESVQVLNRKFEAQLSTAGSRGENVLKSIVETGRMMNDFTASLGANGHIEFTGNGSVHASVANTKRYRLHNNAVSQLAERLGVPGAYAREMAADTAASMSTAWRVAGCRSKGEREFLLPLTTMLSIIIQ
jgi:hypothetical protein